MRKHMYECNTLHTYTHHRHTTTEATDYNKRRHTHTHTHTPDTTLCAWMQASTTPLVLTLHCHFAPVFLSTVSRQNIFWLFRQLLNNWTSQFSSSGSTDAVFITFTIFAGITRNEINETAFLALLIGVESVKEKKQKTNKQTNIFLSSTGRNISLF